MPREIADDPVTSSPATEFTSRAPATPGIYDLAVRLEPDHVQSGSEMCASERLPESLASHNESRVTSPTGVPWDGQAWASESGERSPDAVATRRSSVDVVFDITHDPEFRKLLDFLQLRDDLPLDNIAKLIREMKDVNIQDSHGVTPLLWLTNRAKWSCGEYAMAAVAMVVERGADVDLADNNGTTPLLQLVHNITGELRKHFLGLDQAYLKDLLIHLRTARILTRLFLHNHANPIVKDKDGESAYSYAIDLQQAIKRSLIFDPGMRINFPEDYEGLKLEDHDASLELVDLSDINLCPHLLRYKSDCDWKQTHEYDMETYIEDVYITLGRDLNLFLGDIVQEGERRRYNNTQAELDQHRELSHD